MAFVDGSKLYAVKIVDGKKVLYEVTKDDVRKAPHVDSLPDASGGKRGLVYLYDDGDGEKAYICVKSGEDEYEWLPMDGSGSGEEYLTKDAYDRNGSVSRAGGIKSYVDTAVSEKQDQLYFDYTPTYYSYNPVYSDGIKRALDEAGVQSDWGNNTSSSKAYIQNKPFYDASTQTNSRNLTFTATGLNKVTFSINGKSYIFFARSTSSSSNLFSQSRKRVIVDNEVFDFTTYNSATVTVDSTSYSGYLIFKDDIFVIFQRYSGGSYYIYTGIPFADGLSHSVYVYDYSGTLAQVPKKYIDLSSREKISNKATVVSNTSTDMQYPSAKAVYDFVSQNSSSIVLGTITLNNTGWSGNNPYTRTVTVSNATITSKSKIDIQPDAAAMVQLELDGITALWIENNNGALTANTIGGIPTVSLTIQCTVMEAK